jgi:hypothetical protein
MKNSIITGILFLISGLLLIFGPTYLFKVCPVDEMIMKCHWSVQGEIGIGIIVISLGLLLFFSKAKESRIVLNIIAIITYLVAILIPTVLIGGCENNKMSCQSLTFPVIYLIAGINIMYIIINIYFLLRSKRTTRSAVIHEEK